MLFFKQIIGRTGEQEAARFLRKKGLKIIQMNYKNQIGEIDIIAKERGMYVFAEVKTRTSTDFGFPAQAVDFKKQKKIINVAKTYLENAYNESMRFDVIEVYMDKVSRKVTAINHIENAFGE